MAVFREPIAASLHLAGYDTLMTSNGRQAMEAILKKWPDLILLDLSMPIMDGHAFLVELKRIPEFSDLPIILLSANSDRDMMIKVAKLGISEYLLKSQFSTQELLTRVQKYVPIEEPLTVDDELLDETEPEETDDTADDSEEQEPATALDSSE